MDYSDRMADRMRDDPDDIAEEADEAMREAEAVAMNDEPNDRDDVEYYRMCKKRHREVMRKLDAIQQDVDELSRPMDGGSTSMMGKGMGGMGGFSSDFGFGGGGMAPDGYDDEDRDTDDWTRWL
ncbi:hypothetical protein [Salinigranum halophilum]|uniref:hypothetical protein n=1 Tax=Salinigranum halophilum TaxID=2565931 RepID=UPI001375EFFF|nr:hypothetical protein [Salinigranum halophilum]